MRPQYNTKMDNQKDLKPGWLQYLPIYLAGAFSLSLNPMIVLLIPLYALSIEASPLMIGIATSAVAIVPLILSISSGALVDRLGAKRILVSGPLLLASISVLYPVFPSMIALIIFGLFYGQISTTNWISVQTYIAKLGKKKGHIHTSRFSFFTNAGMFMGPLLVGFFWDALGPWGGYGIIIIWALCLWLCGKFLPIDKEHENNNDTKWSELLPKLEPYKKAYKLLFIPGVVIVLTGTFMRISVSNINASFLAVYLSSINYSATSIALMYSCWSLFGVFAPLVVSKLVNKINEVKLLFFVLLTGVFPLSLVPLFEQFSHLLILIVISGFSIGMTLPLTITILSRSISGNEQGLAVGLRTTGNRIASFIIPLMFGLIVQGLGIHISFVIVSIILILPIVIIFSIFMRRVK
ncbi:hypothetical protein BTR23_24980 [Alkalihalophilus pseudofirmus]|nr:hypothetical protein BTR23_24980 [Alkalihalophilus pseudofirmus]